MTYLLMKRGLYYRPNAQGYTGIREHAGRYTESEARGHHDPISGVSMIRDDDAPEFSPSCFPDLARDHLLKQRDDLRAALAAITYRSPDGKICNRFVECTDLRGVIPVEAVPALEGAVQA